MWACGYDYKTARQPLTGTKQSTVGVNIMILVKAFEFNKQTNKKSTYNVDYIKAASQRQHLFS